MASIACYVVSHFYGDYLDQCLKSLLCQTVYPQRLIMVNNGGEPKSQRIFSSYVKAFEEAGVSVELCNLDGWPLLKVIDWVAPKVKEDYLFRLDADDYIAPDFISQMVSKQFETNADLIYCGYKKIDQAGATLSEEYATNLNCLSTPPHGACTFLSRRLRKRVGQYVDYGRKGQDGLINWIAKDANGLSSSFVSKPLFSYRQHARSLTFDALEFAAKRLAVFESGLGNESLEAGVTLVCMVPSHMSEADVESALSDRLEAKWREQAFFKLKKVWVLCGTGHREICKTVVSKYANVAAGLDTELREIDIDLTLSDHLSIFLNSSLFRQHDSAEGLKARLLVDLISEKRLDSIFVRLSEYYMTPQFSRRLIAYGYQSRSLAFEVAGDFCQAALPTDLRRLSFKPRFHLIGGTIGLGEGFRTAERSFIGVRIK